MSILSKMFIVMLVVLSIATSVATIIIQRDVLQPKVQLAEVNRRHQEMQLTSDAKLAEMDRQRQSWVDRHQVAAATVRERDETIKKHETRIHDLTVRLTQASKELADAKLDLATWTSMATRTQNELRAAETKADGFKTKLETATQNYNQSNQKLAEVSAQRDFLLQQVKMLREQIVVLQERLNTQPAARAAADGLGGETVRPVLSGPTIKGKVLRVAENMSMATIDVGTNDGVLSDMTFDVYRGDKFLAELVITDVHARMAVGRLQKVQNRIQEEDRVSNNLRAN